MYDPDEISFALEESYSKGWSDAKKFYQEEFFVLVGEGCYISRQEIEDIFKDYPEDEMQILSKAALSRGQP